MRVALYNQFFGINGRSLPSTLFGYLALYHTKSPNLVHILADLNNTVETINSINADIVGFCEVLESQEEELELRFKNNGYYIYFGEGYKTRISNQIIKPAIASKFKGVNIKVNNLPIEKKIGGGGGIVHSYFPDLDLNFLNVHFACIRKNIHEKQINFLRDYITEINSKLILTGDFNIDYKGLKHGKYLDGLVLVSDKIKTCTLTPLFSLFYHKDIDHIFARGYEVEMSGFLESRSDHRLIYSDLSEIKN